MSAALLGSSACKCYSFSLHESNVLWHHADQACVGLVNIVSQYAVDWMARRPQPSPSGMMEYNLRDVNIEGISGVRRTEEDDSQYVYDTYLTSVFTCG